MSIIKILNSALNSAQTDSYDLEASNSQIDQLASKFVKILNKRQILSNDKIKKAKKSISRRLDQQCEKNPALSQAIITRIKNKVFKKIDQKLVKYNRNVKITRKRQICSSSEDEPCKKEEQLSEESEEQESLDNPHKTKKIKKERKDKKVYRKRKYETFDQEFKEEVCLYAEKMGVQQASQKYNLSLRKVMNWVEAHQLNVLGKGRKALDPIMQYNISIWILRKIWDQVPLTQKIIRQKAATLKTLSKPFNGSKGWLQKFFLRHVQLKSCFDIRNKIEQRSQCARYHQSAFQRLHKDCENLLRSGQNSDLVVQSDLKRIIYFRQDHPLLKLKADKNLDKQRIQDKPLFQYDQIKQLNIKKCQQQEDSQHNSNLYAVKSSQNIMTKSEQLSEFINESESEVNEQQSFKQEQDDQYEQKYQQESFSSQQSEQPIMKKQQQMYSSDIKYEIYEQDSSQGSEQRPPSKYVKKCEEQQNGL